MGALPTVDAAVNRPWTGDFDGMLERAGHPRARRASKTHYFVEEGQQRGVAYEAFAALEQELNKASRRKGTTKVHAVFIPTSYDRIVADLTGVVATSPLPA